MAALEIVALDTATPQLRAPGVSDTYSIPRSAAFSAGLTLGWSTDLFLQRDAANTLALRNGTNAQAFNVYNTYTDASNYERARFAYVSNVLEIGHQAAGTGTASRVTRLFGGASTNYFEAAQFQLNTVVGGFVEFTVAAASARVKNTGQFGFSSSATATASADTGIGRDSAGVMVVTNGSTGSGYLKFRAVAIGSLPSAATVGAGTRGHVTDALTPTFGATVTAGGAVSTPVYSDGSNWIVG